MIEPHDWYYCPVCGRVYRYDDKLRQYVQACDCVWIEDVEEEHDTTVPTTTSDD